MKAELVPLNGDPPIPITRDVTVVGRRDVSDVRIDHASLSKRHCVLVRTDGLLMLRDLATTNGTKVNGQRVRWAALLPNDRLTLGRYKMRVYLGPDHEPSPSERAARVATPPRAATASSHPPTPALFPAPTPDPEATGTTPREGVALGAGDMVHLEEGDLVLGQWADDGVDNGNELILLD